jgi:very-short-patch-repair endonuclease
MIDFPMSRLVRSFTPPNVRAQAKRLRQALTPAEARLWDALRDHRLQGLKFRRQHPMGPFIADFYCPASRLIVEVDGGIHKDLVEQDLARTSHLVAHGYRVIRFRNEDVENHLEHVLSAILTACLSPKST